METRARESVDGETYMQVFRSDACRIGVTAVENRSGKVSFSIEVLITSVNMGKGEVLSGLTDLVSTVKLLGGRGYLIVHEGDGWLIACKRLMRGSINSELKQVASIIKKDETKRRHKSENQRATGLRKRPVKDAMIK